jgi:ERCC4-type nuclease
MDSCDFIISPFTIAVDTREQAPWSFLGIKADAKDNEKPLLVKTVQKTLQTGDYSIEGLEGQIAVERKSHSDLVGSVSSGRDRFEREFVRMSTMPYAAVIVEASMAEILHHPPLHSKMNPKAVIRTALSWSIRYGVHWWFAPSRSHAETLCFRLLQQFWKIKQEDRK